MSGLVLRQAVVNQLAMPIIVGEGCSDLLARDVVDGGHVVRVPAFRLLDGRECPVYIAFAQHKDGQLDTLPLPLMRFDAVQIRGR